MLVSKCLIRKLQITVMLMQKIPKLYKNNNLLYNMTSYFRLFLTLTVRFTGTNSYWYVTWYVNLHYVSKDQYNVDNN